jgi:hypothetical protein
VGKEGQSVELWRNKMSRYMSFGVISFEVQRILVVEMGCVECGVEIDSLRVYMQASRWQQRSESRGCTTYESGV